MKDVSRFTFRDAYLGAPITAEVCAFPSGSQVSVYGGHLPHIGAVSIAFPDGSIQTQCFPGHRDDAVSEKWARTLSENDCVPAVVTAGIHYDELEKADIPGILETTDRLLKRVLSALSLDNRRE